MRLASYLIIATGILASTLLNAASKNSTLSVSGCRENRDLKELLELGKIRAQEKYLIEEPETYQTLKNIADEKIAQLNKSYDAECKKDQL